MAFMGAPLKCTQPFGNVLVKLSQLQMFLSSPGWPDTAQEQKLGVARVIAYKMAYGPARGDPLDSHRLFFQDI